MRCDVCHAVVAEGEGETVAPVTFRILLNNGFGVHEDNIDILVSDGMSRISAVEALTRQYAASETDWLLCRHCVADANAILTSQKSMWIDKNHVAVTSTAQKVGLGYDIAVAPVALTRRVWTACVEWVATDNEQQCYQEQDARSVGRSLRGWGNTSAQKR